MTGPSQFECTKEAYCIVGKDKDWIVVRIDHRSECSIEDEFKMLAGKWRQQTGGDSSMSAIVSNINYLQVIALGKKAVPFILRELQREPAPWFVALQAVTGENPADDPQLAGDFPRIANAWLQWGRECGYLNGAASP
jgi:hypothetical protein